MAGVAAAALPPSSGVAEATEGAVAVGADFDNEDEGAQAAGQRQEVLGEGGGAPSSCCV